MIAALRKHRVITIKTLETLGLESLKIAVMSIRRRILHRLAVEVHSVRMTLIIRKRIEMKTFRKNRPLKIKRTLCGIRFAG